MDYKKARKEMVRLQLKGRGIRDERVLRAMESVPREKFLPPESRSLAYIDSPINIASGQTISQPYMVARLLEILQLSGSEEVLEIGTGSGYSTALLAILAREVVSLERDEVLYHQARENLEFLEQKNIRLILSDGSLGYQQALFPAIIVHASAPAIPPSLIKNLSPEGRLVIPVRDNSEERLHLITKDSAGKTEETLLDFCHFVPLIGKEGFAS